jgi:schlafen family protein
MVGGQGKRTDTVFPPTLFSASATQPGVFSRTMDTQDRNFQNFLENPRESLAIELKQWIDPSTPEGTAKIARACIALRNNNGGRLVIGFKNDSSLDSANAPADARASFHIDVVQAIVSRYSAELFPIDVQFYEIGGQVVPVVVVPPGVKTPVAAKADLCDSSGKQLIRDHAVYVRSLQSNNIVSSTEARRGDWDAITRICFDNREADIGGFVRRHLSTINIDSLRLLIPSFAAVAGLPSLEERVGKELDRGRSRFDNAFRRRNLSLPKAGFRESAILVQGEFPPQSATKSFLQKLLLNAPHHTGWPPWIELQRESHSPYVLDRGWEALLFNIDASRAFSWPHVDFWRIEPSGIFYQLRVLEDDLAGERGPEPGTQLDFLLQISRVAEIILMGLSFGRSLGCDETKASLVFGFRWSGLLGRRLTSWVEPIRAVWSRDSSNEDQITTIVTLPLETPVASISPHVERAVKDLFALFGGTEFESSVIEGIVANISGRRM